MDHIMWEVLPIARERVLRCVQAMCGSGKPDVDSDAVVNGYFWKDRLFEVRLQKETYLTIRLNLPKFHTGLEGQMLTFLEIKEALWKISDQFDLPLNQTLIHNIEIHLDVALSFPVREVLNSIKYYRTRPVSQTRTTSNYKACLECQSGSSRYKLYDVAAIHGDGPGYSFRAESHFSKMQGFHNHPVSLATLLDKDFLSEKYKKLVARFNSVLIVEPLDRSILTFEDREFHELWSDLQYIDESMRWNSVNRKRAYKKLDDFNAKFGKGYKVSIQKELAKTMEYALTH